MTPSRSTRISNLPSTFSAMTPTSTVHSRCRLHASTTAWSRSAPRWRSPGAASFTNVPAGGSATLTFTNGAQVTVDSAGNVTFVQNGAFESLASGQKDELTFQYRLLDTGDPAGSGSGLGAPATANANVRI